MSLPDDPPGTHLPPRPQAVLVSLASAAAGPAFAAAGWTVATTLPRSAGALLDPASLQAPARLIVTFGCPADAALFEGQYQVEHLALVLAIPRLTAAGSALVAGEPGGKRGSYHWLTTLTFSTMADLVAGLSSQAGQAALTQVATFATGGATARIVSGASGVIDPPTRHASRTSGERNPRRITRQDRT